MLFRVKYGFYTSPHEEVVEAVSIKDLEDTLEMYIDQICEELLWEFVDSDYDDMTPGEQAQDEESSFYEAKKQCFAEAINLETGEKVELNIAGLED